MALELQANYQTRLFYEPNGTSVYPLPRGNLYAAIDMLLKLEVNIAAGGASNAPDFQVMNAIDNISLIRNKNKTVWSLSGQALAMYCSNRRISGVAAGGNAAIAGAAGNDKVGQHFLSCPAAPFDAANPKDFAIDTRGPEYELKIKWRDLTAAGTLFGTHTGAITCTNSENYIDIELKTLALRPNPLDGKPDSLASVSPMVVGLREERLGIAANNTQFEIDLTDGQEYRNVILYNTHIANTLCEVGENDIIQSLITLRDTQNKTIQSRRADMVREQTSQNWGMGSSLHNGVYDLNLTMYGNAVDIVKSTPVRDLRINLDVVKQTNATYVRPVFVTQERQI